MYLPYMWFTYAFSQSVTRLISGICSQRFFIFMKSTSFVFYVCFQCSKNLSTSFQFSSVTQSCLTLCDPMDCSMPGFHIHHQLPELAQTHIPQVGGAIQPSCPLLSPSAPALDLSQQQGLCKWVSSSNHMAKVLEFQLQHQSFQWIFRTDFL